MSTTLETRNTARSERRARWTIAAGAVAVVAGFAGDFADAWLAVGAAGVVALLAGVLVLAAVDGPDAEVDLGTWRDAAPRS